MKVEFLKKYRKWKVGDLDDFKQKKADFLIKLDWAKEFIEPKEIEVKEPKVVKAKKKK